MYSRTNTSPVQSAQQLVNRGVSGFQDCVKAASDRFSYYLDLLQEPSDEELVCQAPVEMVSDGEYKGLLLEAWVDSLLN